MQDRLFFVKSTAQTLVQVNAFIRSVYNWMAIGLGLTGVVAFFVSNNQTMVQLIFGNPMIFFGLIIGEFALVIMLQSRIEKLSVSKATSYFLLYSILNGATFASVFLYYTRSSISSVFFICAGTFVVCSIYGMTTKRDLTSMAGFLMMGLFGIIVASIVNMFIGSAGMSMIISYIGVLIFVGLTAYDTQQLKTMALSQPAGLDKKVVQKGAILGALKLYLDFINLFFMFLRIFGIAKTEE